MRIKVPTGGDVPESYYLKLAMESIDTSQYTTADVSAGGSLDIDVDIDKPDSILR